MYSSNNDTTDPANKESDSSLAVIQEVKERMGVQLNQRPTTNISEKIGYSRGLNHSDTVIKEPGWTLENILDRYKFVGSYPISASSPSGTIIQRFRVPHDLTLNNPTTQAPFSAFKYWTGDIELNVQLAASPGVQGCLAMVYVPLTDSQFIENNILTNFSALSINQVCYLFPNANTAAKMTIPFNSPYSMLDLTGEVSSLKANLGFVYLIVFNTFQLSQNTSDDTHASLFVNFCDSKFKVPRLSGTSGKIYRSARAEADEDPSRKEPSSGSSGVLDTIAKVVEPANVLFDGFKTISSLFALDKPTVVANQPPTKVTSTQYLNSCNGVENIDKMSIYPQHVSLPSPSSFATTTDEMEFRHLYSKFSYLGSFKVSTQMKVGTVVGSYPMSPTPSRIRYEPGGKTGSYSKIPLLQYLSIPFEYWNGALVYRVQVVSTMMQSCKLFFGLNYGTFTPATTLNLNEVSSQYGQIVEINQGSNTFDIKAEYIAQAPMLHVSSSNQPSEFDAMGYVNIAVLNKLISGFGSPQEITLNIFFAGGENFNLSTLSESKPLIPVAIPPAPSKTFKGVHEVLYEEHKLNSESEEDPADFEIVRRYANRLVKRQAHAQSAAQPIITPYSEVDQGTKAAAAAPSSGNDTRPTQSQPYVQSVRHLLRKYQMLPSQAATKVKGVGGSTHHISITELFHRSLYPNFAEYDPNNTVAPPSLGLITHYQRIYRQFYGSLNFKIMTRGKHEFSVFYSPPIHNSGKNNLRDPPLRLITQGLYSFDERNLLGKYDSIPDIKSQPYLTRLPVVYTNQPNRTAEFNVPYTSRFHSLIASQGAIENTLTNREYINMGDIFIVEHNPSATFTGSEEEITSFDMYMCLGDDARFGNLFNIPNVTTRYSQLEEGTNNKPDDPSDLQDSPTVYNTLLVFP